MAKLRPYKMADGTRIGWTFFCPGCNETHNVTTVRIPNGRWPCWTTNDDVENPTFGPSIRVTFDTPTEHSCCHSFVVDGRIQYLPDCTHALAGQTVELPEIPDE